jgi:hypothetical protein
MGITSCAVDVAPGSGLFVEHKNDTWIAKPDRPFGKLQRDLYEGAFRVDEKMFGCTIDIETMNDRLYVSKSSWQRLVDLVDGLSLENMESLVGQRKSDVESFMRCAKDAKIGGVGFGELFAKYESAVAHFHFRWNFSKAVDRLLEAEIARLPAQYEFDVMLLAKDAPPLETLRSSEYFHQTLQAIAEHPDTQNAIASSNGTLIEVMKESSWLWERVAYLAENFMKVHNEDIRLPIPYSFVANELRNHLVDSYRFSVPINAVPEGLAEEIRLHAGDRYDQLIRTVTLAAMQGILKENEHHYQIRGQNAMKIKLEELADDCVARGMLGDRMDIYEVGKQRVLDLAADFGGE